MLHRFTSSFQSLSPGAQATIFGVLSLVFAFQGVRRYEEQPLVAFLLALGAVVLFWLAFAKMY